jgi:hypothetical protein
VQTAAENIKNNENLKARLAAAKEKSMYGLSSASQMAGQAAFKLQENASSLMEKNYHGQLYEAA